MALKKKHIPQRTCIACRTVQNKQDLIRIVKLPNQTIVIDAKGKMQGRGAYLCKQLTCWQKGLNKGIISRALKTVISDDNIAQLTQYTTNFL